MTADSTSNPSSSSSRTSIYKLWMFVLSVTCNDEATNRCQRKNESQHHFLWQFEDEHRRKCWNGQKSVLYSWYSWQFDWYFSVTKTLAAHHQSATIRETLSVSRKDCVHHSAIEILTGNIIVISKLLLILLPPTICRHISTLRYIFEPHVTSLKFLKFYKNFDVIIFNWHNSSRDMTVLGHNEKLFSLKTKS